MSRQLSVVPEAATFDFEQVTDAMHRMLGVLGAYANRDGWCWPKLATLAQHMRRTEGAVSKMIAKLVAAGYVEMHYETRGGRRRCVYRIIYDRPRTTAGEIPGEALEDADEPSDSQAQVSVEESLDENVPAPRLAVEESQGAPRVDATETQPLPRQVATFPQKESVLHISGSVERGTALPTPPARTTQARVSTAAEPAPLEHEFTNPLHRDAYLAIRAGHRFAIAFDATLRSLHCHENTGTGFAWHVIGEALAKQRGNGESFNELRLKGYCRRILEAADAGPGMRAAVTRSAPARVRIGTHEYSAMDLWALCVAGGLAARGQNREALVGRVQALVARGQVSDADTFLALVLHVRPWELAAVTFEKSRTEQLAAALESWIRARGHAA